jgi:hypothetical protein
MHMSEMNILNQIAGRDRDRMRIYKEMLDFYQGKQWPGRERWGEKRLTFNYARVFIDKITSYLMSGINFTVEPVRDTPEGQAAAERAEKLLTRVYQDNGLEQTDFETETDCAVLGDACYKVVWDNQSQKVRTTTPDIQGIFAWWMGDDIARVWRVASRYRLSEEEVEMLYPKSQIPGLYPDLSLTGYSKSQISNPNVWIPDHVRNGSTIVEVWTEKEFELYMEGRLIEKKANPYGFIPFIIFPNLREPKQFWGTSDLVQIREPQEELNRAFSQISHILEISGNPVAVLENVEESTDIAVRPGAVWNIPEDAKAYLLDLLQGGGLKQHLDYIDMLYRAMHDLSESPRAAFGGANLDLSGTAMQIELYPLIQKVLRKRAIRTSVYNKRNQMILKLLEIFGGEKTGDLRPRVVWGQILPQDKVQLVNNETALVQNGIHSRKRAMDEVGVKDPEAEFAHWMEEQEQINKMQGTKNKDLDSRSGRE